MRIKILSDFDGVWTDQALEAQNVKIFLAAEAARFAGVGGDQAFEHFQQFERRIKADPARFGWAPDGRITAYVDEDPFCEANAIAAYIEASGSDGQADRLALRYRKAILAGGEPSLSAFADRCFLRATADYRVQHPPALVPHARDALFALQAAGADVTVVSNSVSEKIIGWFGSVGVDAGEEDGRLLRVRGAAGKQVLGASDAHIVVAGRRIHVDRPRYRRIIEEEGPDIVIGDVFSLDLALPHVMRSRERHPAAPAELVLRKHPHTPRWIVDTRAEGAIDRIVDGVIELVSSIERLRDARA